MIFFFSFVESKNVLFTQGRFDELWKNFTTYTSGEQLLGLPVTENNFLHQKKFVTILPKLSIRAINENSIDIN